MLCPGGKTGFAGLCFKTASVGGVLGLVINVLLFAGLALALIFLIFGGIRWIISGGDKAKVDVAKQAVVSALIGLVVVLSSYILMNVVLHFFGIGPVSSLNFPSFRGF